MASAVAAVTFDVVAVAAVVNGIEGRTAGKIDQLSKTACCTRGTDHDLPDLVLQISGSEYTYIVRILQIITS